ncbi:KxYKxGKxW signal peptide domain-containing protein [Lacticaseibacillus baoqingensis]|uniref:KxYKxGKxW signal peptide domain-containing protein n=1 Tax=Lacticaseibacillus baoqingensis TaxID=2486013 RepID=A0ABW4E4C7_9LACO|nr:KxYKxGKxW signal peptide domain-containing protein [Lacticaseibacillus baoqingensis]
MQDRRGAKKLYKAHKTWLAAGVAVATLFGAQALSTQQPVAAATQLASQSGETIADMQASVDYLQQEAAGATGPAKTQFETQLQAAQAKLAQLQQAAEDAAAKQAAEEAAAKQADEAAKAKLAAEAANDAKIKELTDSIDYLQKEIAGNTPGLDIADLKQKLASAQAELATLTNVDTPQPDSEVTPEDDAAKQAAEDAAAKQAAEEAAAKQADEAAKAKLAAEAANDAKIKELTDSIDYLQKEIAGNTPGLDIADLKQKLAAAQRELAHLTGETPADELVTPDPITNENTPNKSTEASEQAKADAEAASKAADDKTPQTTGDGLTQGNDAYNATHNGPAGTKITPTGSQTPTTNNDAGTGIGAGDFSAAGNGINTGKPTDQTDKKPAKTPTTKPGANGLITNTDAYIASQLGLTTAQYQAQKDRDTLNELVAKYENSQKQGFTAQAELYKQQVDAFKAKLAAKADPTPVDHESQPEPETTTAEKQPDAAKAAKGDTGKTPTKTGDVAKPKTVAIAEAAKVANAATAKAAQNAAATAAKAATYPATGDDTNAAATALGVVAVMGALFGLAGTGLKKRA